MKIKWITAFLLAALVVALAVPISADDGKPKTVTVTGEGTSYEEAKADAMRNAVEEAAGAEIASHSQTKDFALVKDEIVSRANGYCSAYDEISKKENGGIWTVKARVTVKVGKVTSDWGEVALLIKQKGHPKVLIMIVDQIDGKQVSTEQANSMVADYFLSKGMRLVDKDQIKAVHAKEIKAATLSNDVSKLISLASTYKAQLVVSGTAQASFAKSASVYGQTFHYYSANVTMKVYRTDDAQLIFQKNWALAQNELARDGSKTAAANKGIKKITERLTPEAFKGITRRWIKDLFTGNEVTLVISECPYRERRRIKKEIKEKIKKITDVAEMSYSNKTMELTLVTTLTTTQILDKLVDLEIIPIEAADNTTITGNKIQIKLGGG